MGGRMNYKKHLIILLLLGIVFMTILIYIVNYLEEDSCEQNDKFYNNLTYPNRLEFFIGEYDIACPKYTNNKFRWGSIFSRL